MYKSELENCVDKLKKPWARYINRKYSKLEKKSLKWWI
jgi:hypothetical protein